MGEPTVPLSARGNHVPSAPEPDIAVLTCSVRELTDRPRPRQIRLAVEVSDTFLEYDLSRKGDFYAKAGIVEYWVADVATPRIVVHRDPVDGAYQTVVTLGAEGQIAPLAAPEAAIRVGELFQTGPMFADLAL